MAGIVILGGGKIGRMIANLLLDCGDYQVTIGDSDPQALQRLQEKHARLQTVPVDATDAKQLAAVLKGNDAVISALSFHFNPLVAQVSLEQGVSYFDLTEDVETTRAVRQVASQAADGQIFMPQCGLAPGFISIVANDLTKSFEKLDRVHMRVGALPQFPTGELKYNLTWSTDGLINEYCNPCEAIEENQRIEVLPLEGLEHFSLDGVRYEAFNTSGGLGTLCESLDGKVRELNYKTVRYVGHRHLMKFLVNELRMNQKRDLLKDIMEDAVPITFQDVVVTFCTVTGWRNGNFVQISDARKIYADQWGDEHWSAIQITTASGICAVVDMHFARQLPATGFVKQEDVELDAFLKNRFGKNYHSSSATRFSHAHSNGNGVSQ